MAVNAAFGRLPVRPTNLNYIDVLPFGTASKIRGERLLYSPRIIPDRPLIDVIRDDSQLFDVASLPGLKIVQMPDAAHVNRALALTFVKALNEYRPTEKGKDSAVLATGGTWDGPRMIMGTPEYAKQVIGEALPLDRGLIWSCLDEYGYDKESLESLYAKIGTRDSFVNSRMNPPMYGDLHRLFLFGAGYSEKDYIFPPVGFDVPGENAGMAWRKDLLSRVYPSVVMAHGIGSYPFHDAFNDFTDFDAVTGYYPIAGSTKLQNGNDTTPAGWEQMSLMFRNIAAAFRINDPENVFRKAEYLRRSHADTVPQELSYYVSRMAWEEFSDTLPQQIELARRTISRMPEMVLTQGLADMMNGGTPGGVSADLHIFGVAGGQKANAFKYCFCRPADEKNPASAANYYGGRTIVFVDDLAAHYAGDFAETFWKYEPDDATREIIENGCTAKAISEEFWQAREADPAREKWTD